MAKKKKHRHTPPETNNPAPGPVPWTATAAVVLGAAGLLTTCFYYVALPLHAAAVLLGQLTLRQKNLPHVVRVRARVGISLGLFGAAVIAALLLLVLTNPWMTPRPKPSAPPVDTRQTGNRSL